METVDLVMAGVAALILGLCLCLYRFAALHAAFAWGIDWARTGQPPQWLAGLTAPDVSPK